MIDLSALGYRPCVGVLVFNRQGRVFVGRRFGADEEGVRRYAWQMPQGGIDEGEKPEAAALRELYEETGIVPENVELIGKIPGWLKYDLPIEEMNAPYRGKYRGQKQKWFALRFLGTDKDIDLAGGGQHPEFETWKWVEIDDLPDLVVPFKRMVYEQVVAAFRDLV